MTRAEFDDLTLAVFLVGLAGFVDAVGFLMLGGLFVSFMSGNSTQFAVRTGQGAWTGAGAAGGLVILFVAGVVAERFFAGDRARSGRVAILTLEAALLALAAFVPGRMLAAALAAFAMGAQNGVLHSAGRTTTGLTYVTGTLVHFGEALADALKGEGPASASFPYLALWTALIAGGALGALAYRSLAVEALVLPSAAAALIAAALASGLVRPS